jgi:hypothetical protein
MTITPEDLAKPWTQADKERWVRETANIPIHGLARVLLGRIEGNKPPKCPDIWWRGVLASLGAIVGFYDESI